MSTWIDICASVRMCMCAFACVCVFVCVCVCESVGWWVIKRAHMHTVLALTLKPQLQSFDQCVMSRAGVMSMSMSMCHDQDWCHEQGWCHEHEHEHVS